MQLDLTQFPHLTETQLAQFEALGDLYTDWNSKINVISRKDIDNLYLHHVQHSLAVACFVNSRMGGWRPGTTVVDVGCGGGFPGVPLAIMYPDVRFLLVDRIGKKVRVAQAVADAVGLTNVETRHAGIEEVRQTFDFAVSRAVMELPDLLKLVRRCTRHGLICLKGGDLEAELSPAICRGTVVEPISQWFGDEFFVTKSVVYTPF
ncbi:MAG: 16S rRNA (guanine(527)-N(7))-methyltransferase RsmG [Bacteroidales bacterium]|nr:16S rRNA (guanine(527)-N(7))-methyltransferase RsmG [Candidatus Liminaster caballi]